MMRRRPIPGPAWLRPVSVRLRLTLWNVAGLALLLLTLGALLRSTLQASLDHMIRQRLIQDARRTQYFFSLPVLDSPPPGFRRPFFAGGPGQEAGLDGPLPPRVLGLDGRGMPPFSGGAWDADAVAQAAQGREVFSDIRTGDGAARILSVPLRRDRRIVGVIQVGSRMAGAEQEISRLTHVLLTLIPLVLLLAAAGGALLTGTTLRPVRRITEAAGHIEAQDLSGRLPVSGGDEFGTLAATFNGMLARLEDAFARLTRANADLTRANQRLTQAYEQQRRFTADASHELRTPLTVIKANTSLALLEPRTPSEYREALEAVDRAVDRTSQLVQDLLLLARADADQLQLPRTLLELRDVLAQTLDATGCLGDPRVRLEDFDSGWCVLGHSGMLVRLFGNLLTNALRYTPAPGRVTVMVKRRPGQVVVTVQDTGQGIAPEHLPHLFERFYRADAARSAGEGTGLGLSICRSVAEAHGGAIQVESLVGVGTTVTVTLPCPSSTGSMEAAMTPLPSGAATVSSCTIT